MQVFLSPVIMIEDFGSGLERGRERYDATLWAAEAAEVGEV